MHHASPQALGRQGVCSCSYAQPALHCAHVRPLAGGRRLLRPRHGPPPLRYTNTGVEYRNAEDPEDYEGVVNLGEQYQVYKPELGPLDQRVTLSWLDGILEGEVNLEDTEYWFTEPEGGWNAGDKVVKIADEAIWNHAKGYVGGADDGRKPLNAFKPGDVVKGVVRRHHIDHGILVDVNGMWDGLLPVKFRPYDVKLNPNNSASAADAARMILGNKGETVEETMAKLASPIVEEDPEDDCARTDPWEVFGFRLHPGEEVVCRVHQTNPYPATRFALHLELLEPADLRPWMMPLKHYKWAYDLRGLDSVQAVEAATGLKLPVRVLTDEYLSDEAVKKRLNPDPPDNYVPDAHERYIIRLEAEAQARGVKPY